MTDRSRASDLRAGAVDAATEAGLPEEVAISCPVPSRRDSALSAAFFASPAVSTPDGRNLLVFRPMARIELSWDDASPRDVTLRDDVLPVDDDDPVGALRPEEFAGARYGEEEARFEEAERAFLELLDEVAPLFGLGETDPDAQARCLDAFRRVVPEQIRPLYRELGPDFFRWLEGEGTGGG